MSWKDVLVVANSAGPGAACVRAAAALADRHDAGLTICVPAVIPSFAGLGDVPATAELLAEMLANVKSEAEQAARTLEAAAGRVAQPFIMETSEADLRADVAGLAQTADVVVVLQPSRHHKALDSSAILDGALFGSGRPVLMIPEAAAAPAFGSRILVGWKPGREASRALHDAMPMLAKATAVKLFTGSEESIGAAEHAGRIARLSDHLRRHGVPLAQEDQQPSPRGANLLEAAKTWGADMIVMGAYGHSRLQERVFGGVTQSVVLDGRLPVFFSH